MNNCRLIYGQRSVHHVILHDLYVLNLLSVVFIRGFADCIALSRPLRWLPIVFMMRARVSEICAWSHENVGFS